MFFIFLSSNVLKCNARRGVVRPHKESNQETEGEASGRPADYYFAEKVTDPCGGWC